MISSFVQMYDNQSSLRHPSVMFGWLILLCIQHQLGITSAAGPSMVGSSDSYVGYRPSSGLRVVLSAPHGGLLQPSGIPERDAGCWNSSEKRCIWSHSCGEKNLTSCKAVTVNDIYTQDMTGELYDSLCIMFGGACPAAVFNLLSRRFFDANRELEEATFMEPAVVEAFFRYHELIDAEKKIMGGIGLFIDIHGHGHPTQRAELGYIVSGDALNSASPVDPNKTSIRSLANRSRVPFDELLRGAESFGGFLGLYGGFDSVPSPANRGPGSLPYFNGGPNTRRHGSLNNGSFDAIQIESARTPRDRELRPKYVKALACTIKSYVCKYYMYSHQTQGGAVVDERLANPCDASTRDTECSNSSSNHNGLTGLYLATLAFLLLLH